jgi:hypothetical protein
VLGLLLSLPAAFCDDVKVVILPSIAGKGGPSLSELYDLAKRELAERACVSVREDEAVLERCGADAECIGRAITDVGADVGLTVALVRAADEWLTSVRWVRPGTSENVVETDTSPGPGLVSSALAAQIVAVLDRARVQRGAWLDIDVRPREAHVELVRGGESLPIASGRSLLPPGTYEVVAEAPGHAARREQIELEAGGHASLTLELDEDLRIVERWWFWTLIGAAAAGAAAGVAIGLAADRGPPCLCVASSVGACADPCREH